MDRDTIIAQSRVYDPDPQLVWEVEIRISIRVKIWIRIHIKVKIQEL